MLHLLSLLRPLQSTWGGDRGGGGSDGGGTDGGGADGGSPSHTPQVFVQSCFFLGLYFLHFFSLHFAPFLSVHAGGPGGYRRTHSRRGATARQLYLQQRRSPSDQLEVGRVRREYVRLG